MSKEAIELLERASGFCKDNKWTDAGGGKMTIALHIDQALALLREQQPRTDNQKVLELLEEIEWDNYSEKHKSSTCPICGTVVGEKHCKDCQLDQALALLREQPPKPELQKWYEGKIFRLEKARTNLKAENKRLEEQLRDGHHCQSFDMCGAAHDNYEKEVKRLKELLQEGCDAWYEDTGWRILAKWVRKAEQALKGERKNVTNGEMYGITGA